MRHQAAKLAAPARQVMGETTFGPTPTCRVPESRYPDRAMRRVMDGG